ncbi:caspase family protein [Streptomyces sp. DH24]|uniref:caspase family protein n=1 Tax=Streptomyces sp. DH24 TaxID=3040123 RepID=UPI00244349F5|nr:caspase family protein [Streptomyces sp. DH24]MDG9717229.1 caspase family protein [Streptomyces sp. DH24]
MRYFVAAGTRHYRDAPELPQAHEDMARAAALFASAGYERILTAVSYDPHSEDFENALADWCASPCLTADDVVAVYYAGHGGRSLTGQYRLACANTETGRPGSWLSLPNLAEILAASPVRNVLFVVDACHAAAATAEIGAVTDAVVAGRGRADDFGAGTWLLASARHRDRAVDGAFVTELAKACADGDGPSQRFLSPSVLAERVNRSFVTAGLTQRAACSSVDQSHRPPFFPNPLFEPGAEVTGDGRPHADAQDLSTHFEPRGRGVEHVHDPGSYFTGREHALREARAHLAGQGAGRLLVVTADPGSGKSAVLGRLVLEGHADASVSARHLTLEAVVGRLAGAADVRAATAVTLLKALAERERPFRVVVDSLDEAGPGDDRAEARRIAWELLRPLAAVGCVRLVVGSRRELLPHLGDRVPVIDLDDDAYAGDTDTAAYVRKILCDTGAPYEHRRELARLVAHEIARRSGRCFLVARMTASALLRGPVVDASVPGWAEQLPSDVGGAFEAYLQRLSSGRHATTTALLTALAFGEGDGLPRKVWVRVAARLSGTALAEADIDVLLEEDGSYLAHACVDGTRYFRPYHQELTDHLKERVLRRRDLADVQECFVETLLDLVPGRDWSRAPSYVRAHLATHAAGAGCLDGLVEDASFVVAAEPAALLPAVRHVRRRASLSLAVERYTYLLTDTDQDAGPDGTDRAGLLAFVARAHGEHGLAGQAESLSRSVRRVCVEPREITPHRVVGRHAGDGYAVRFRNPDWTVTDVVLPDGERCVLAAPPDASHVHVWMPDTPARSTVLPHPARVTGLRLLDGPVRRAEAVTLDEQGTLRWWDVADQTLSRAVPDSEWTSLFDAGLLADGTPVLVCGNDERVAALALPALKPLAETDCTTRPATEREEAVGPTACLARDAGGQAHLLVCDGVRGRVSWLPLDEDGAPVVLLDGLTKPVLADHVDGPRGTVVAVCEEWTRLTVLEPATKTVTSAPFRGVADWHVSGFAQGSAAEPVLVASSEKLLTARVGEPVRAIGKKDRAGGQLTAPVLHDGRLFGIAIGFGGGLRVIDCATGDLVGSPLYGHEGAVCTVHALAAPGSAGPDILAVGNDGTARLWRWGSHQAPSAALPSATAGFPVTEVEALIPWSREPASVMAVTLRDHVRRLTPGLCAEAAHDIAQERTRLPAVGEPPARQDRAEDPDGTLHLVTWKYTGHETLDLAPDLPPSPVSYPLWHRLRPDAAPEDTPLRWLHGDRWDRLRVRLLPATRSRPRARFVAFDAALCRARLLNDPGDTGDWAGLPWRVDPARDFVCSTAFTTSEGDAVLMAAARPAVRRESTVGHRHLWHVDPDRETVVPEARLWNLSQGTRHERDGLPLAPDVRDLLPHHGPDGTRWIMQRGRDGAASVIDLDTGRRHDVCSAEEGHGTDAFRAYGGQWTALPDGTPVLLCRAPAPPGRPMPTLVWTPGTAGRPERLPLLPADVHWAGPAPSGEALVAVSDGHGIALCHLPSLETVWYAPLPAAVTALAPLPGSRHLDLAVGTQQGVVFVRPRLPRGWRDRLGAG